MARTDHRTGKTALLILALAGGASYDEAAAEARVSKRTIARRMADPAFRAEVEGLRRSLLDAAMGKLAASTAEAVETLAALMAPDPDTPPATRRAAAEAVLSHALRLREHLDLEARIAALEAAVSLQRPEVAP